VALGFSICMLASVQNLSSLAFERPMSRGQACDPRLATGGMAMNFLELPAIDGENAFRLKVEIAKYETHPKICNLLLLAGAALTC
jgi:hypothetical protein